jgi:hypothetical protein
MGELPNSHGRTLTDKSYVMHGILSGTGTGTFRHCHPPKECLYLRLKMSIGSPKLI